LVPRRTQQHRDRLERLARIDQRIAELTSERAQIFAEMADEAAGLQDGRRLPERRLPELPQIPETDRARARAALRESDHRRRFGR
jgi:hypothetical protein